VLLDTHVLLYWLGAPDRLTDAQRDVLDEASPESPVWVSEISLWEVATLVN
jgi:PIN domain nuclease of toxin-antitoxin system